MAFTFAAFCYTAALIFFAIWHIIAPNTLNPLVLPEYLIHAFFCVMFLSAAEWLTLGLMMSGPELYDPTTIMNADILAYCQKEGWCKLAFYLLAFF
ncbi:hypothetical protein FD755_022843, partial [Muntiacus reevesi]